MKLKSGENYKVRVLEIAGYFYPQIYIKSFWHTGWYYIDMDSPEYYSGTLKRPPTLKVHNKSIEDAENIIRGLKEKFQETEIKSHNEREEQF